jgi:hypothetical protein
MKTMAGYWRNIILVIGVLVATLCLQLCFWQFSSVTLDKYFGEPSIAIDTFASVSNRFGMLN